MPYPILLLLTSVLLWAAPSFNRDQEFPLSDGTSFIGHLQGDEFLNWIETEDGKVLLYSKERRRFEYAVIKGQMLEPSGIPYAPEDASPPPLPDKEALYQIWMDKRYEAYLRRRGIEPQQED